MDDPWWKKKTVHHHHFHFQHLHRPPPSVVYQPEHMYAVAVAIDCNVPFAVAVMTAAAGDS